MSAEAVAVSATSDAPRLKGRTRAHFSMGEVGAPFLHVRVLERGLITRANLLAGFKYFEIWLSRPFEYVSRPAIMCVRGIVVSADYLKPYLPAGTSR